MTQVTARFLGGTVTLAVAGAAAETYSVTSDPRGMGALASPGTCAVRNVVETIVPAAGNLPTFSTAGVQMECTLSAPSPSARSVELFMDMQDDRMLGVGTYTIALGRLALSVQNTSCVSIESDGTATLVVTRAEGGPAPYPAAVTPDYVREFTVHVEAESPASSTPGGCVTPPASATVDLQFAATAADAVNHPDNRCLCG
jgi:hypothetical protein